MKMPTDEVVKDAATFRSNRLGEPLGVKPDAYDRWLMLVRAEAWDQGVLYSHNCHNDHGGLSPSWRYENPYREANDD